MIPDDERFLTLETPAMGNEPESVPWLAAADDYGDFIHGVFLDPQGWNAEYIDGVSQLTSFINLATLSQKGKVPLGNGSFYYLTAISPL